MEIHQIICAGDTASLLYAEKEYLNAHRDFTVSFRRYFLSDRKQKKELGHIEGNVSYVIQPVLGGNKIAVWLFLTRDYPVELLWNPNMHSIGGESEEQTRAILETYEEELRKNGMKIADDCVRTWLYIDDIDNQYAGAVKARRENFEEQGMTKETHYLASTGIFGQAVIPGTTVQIDALAIKGDFSQHYLYAPDNFNPTHEYGVTFERGVVLQYGGESHILISGTASINNKGEIVSPGDPKAQTFRILNNVEALLNEAGSSWNDVKMIVVYLRNSEDYEKIAPSIIEKFEGKTPFVITHAPVCRPGWLVEMECLAVKDGMTPFLQ